MPALDDQVKAHIRRHCAGIYRITLTDERFGQIKREFASNKWIAEIRETSTGNLMRYAGLWNTVKDAAHELQSINPLDL